MAEPRFNEEGERVHNLPWVTLDFDDEGVQIDYFDAWVRRYTEDPIFNHIDWRNPEGRCVKVCLPDEAIQMMVKLGFRQTIELVPSTEVEEWYIAMAMFDADLPGIGVPLEWTE